MQVFSYNVYMYVYIAILDTGMTDVYMLYKIM